MPGISTQLHRFPLERAADVAVAEVSAFLRPSGLPYTARFCCVPPTTFAVYEGRLSRLGA